MRGGREGRDLTGYKTIYPTLQNSHFLYGNCSLVWRSVIISVELDFGDSTNIQCIRSKEINRD